MTSQTVTSKTDDADLTARIDYTDNSLTIQYKVTNRTTHDLYIFNRLFEKTEDGVVLTDKNLAYVLANSKRVMVSKAMAPVPADRKVEYVQVPCVTKIPALSSIEETFTIPLPLTIKTPYQQPEAGSTISRKDLFFSVGYFVGHAQTHTYELTVQTPNGPAIRFDPFAYEDQKLLIAGPFQQPVAVYQQK